MYTYIYTHIHVHIHICVYIYIYIHRYIYTYIYIYSVCVCVYPYSNWDKRPRAWANQRARPAGPKSPRVDPGHSTEALRAAKVDRVARPRRFERQKSIESLDRGASNDKSRPNRAPETLRDAIFDDSGSILGSIFVVFRGNIARAT